MHAATSRLHLPDRGSTARAARRIGLTALLACGLAAPTLLHVAPAAAQASSVSFSTAEAAPADAVAYIVTTLDDRSQQWQLADTLLDRAGLGEALDKAMAEGLTDESGDKLPLDAFLGGEVAFVATQTALNTLAEESMGGADLEEMLGSLGVATPEAAPAEPEAQGFAVALDARAPDTAWAGIQESVKDQPTEEQDYQGTSILYAAPIGDEDGMAAARAGDLILIASAPADLYPLIDTVDGRTPNLTTVPEFSTARDALPSEFLTFGFVNAIDMPSGDLGPLAPLADELTTQSVSALTIAADEPGFRMETVAFPPAGGSFPPAAANFDSELVGTAPDNALFFASAADLGATNVLDVIGATLLGLAFGMGDMSGMMSPEATPVAAGDAEAMIAKQFEDAAALIGVNLQTELFHQLVGEYGAWMTADPASQQVSGLFASKTERPETVANALMQVSYLIQGAAGSESMLSTREVAGGQIYLLDLGDELGGTLEFGVIGDRFVLGSGDAIDRLGGASGSSLADNAQYQAVMATLPAEHNGLVYVDMTQAIPLLEAASAESEDLGLGEIGSVEDANESCANYASQEEAQAAYDAAEPDTFDLDQDFDGQVCEDFFTAAAAAVATPVSGDQEENPFAGVDYSGIKAYGLVSYEDEGLQRSSSILYIAE